jgi:hypothetical protein
VRAGIIVIAGSLALLGGCGYSVRPPYNASVRTIYLPVFKAGNRFRQDLNIQLTELVRKEISDRTPYLVVGNPEEADVTLEGVVIFDNKNVMVESPYNLPRHLIATMSVNVALTDNRTGVVRRKNLYPDVRVSESATFDPEIGESTKAGFAKVMERLARDIVNMLEDPWGPENREELEVVGESGSDDPTSARTRR